MNTILIHALWVSPLFWTLMLLGVAIILFVHNKIRMDVVDIIGDAILLSKRYSQYSRDLSWL